MSAVFAYPAQRHRLTVEEYYRMAEVGILKEDDRIELIEGEIIDMPPVGSLHSSAVNRLNAVFNLCAGTRAIVSVQNPIRLNSRSEPQPDLALLRHRADYYRDAHPGPADVLLLVEVAGSSLRYDVEVKLPLYAQQGIPEIWIVDLEHRRLEIHRCPDGDVYLEKHWALPGEKAVPAGLVECEVDVAMLF